MVNVNWAKLKAMSKIPLRVIVVLASVGIALIALLIISAIVIGWYQWLRTKIGGHLPSISGLSAQGLFEWLTGILGTVGHGLLFALPALAILVLAIWYFDDLSGLCGQLWGSLRKAASSCVAFVVGKEQWRALIFSLLKPGMYFGLLALILALYFSPDPPPAPPVRYIVSADDPVLLPVRLHVHFDNADIGNDRELTERGIALDTTRKTALQETVNVLRRCVTPRSEVTIQTYGFASEDSFGGLSKSANRDLNIEVANRRAKAVHDILEDLSRGITGLTIENPTSWSNFRTMKRQRDLMVPVPDNSRRDAFADRVVVLYLSDPGRCTVVQNVPQ